ncbi:UNVERIFIED_CONTAM: hypothetical protein FKN15_016148 [Acipenser sinensis]
MGLSEPAAQLPLGNATTTTSSANPKLAKNGANQLRKAAEQDLNKNFTKSTIVSGRNIISEQLEGKEIKSNQPKRTKSFLNDFVDLEGETLLNERNSKEGQDPPALNGDDLPPSKYQNEPASPEESQISMALSSPETKKDQPKPGAKTDCALNRIQSLAPSDEDSSWTTLSQDSASLSSPEEAADIWSDQSFQTDPDLPPGWKKISDIGGIYYWHIPTGTTQWERPVSLSADIQGSRNGSLSSVTPSPTPENEQAETQNELFHQPAIWPASSASEDSTEQPAISSSDSTVPSCGFVNSCYFDLQAATVNPDPSLKEFEGATLRYASLKLRNVSQSDEEDSCSINSDPEAKCFAVRSLGWVEMAEEDLAPGKSSVAVNNCIRQLSYCKNDIRDTVGIWGEGKDMYLILENNMLNLVDPMDRSTLHSQPIVSIRVWGVGRDNGRIDHNSQWQAFYVYSKGLFAAQRRRRGKDMYLILENNMLNLVDPMDRSTLHSQPIVSIRVWGVGRDNGRDFAYVARDKDTRILKCHVFRCDTPAKAIATSLHEICSKIMAERKNTKAVAGSSLQERVSVGLDVPLQDFPTPKTELVQKFHVLYLGMLPVAKPIGMDILNGAIDSLVSASGKEDWMPVILNVADATVTVIKEKKEDEVLVECRVRFLSFMGVGRDIHTFAFIMDSGNQHFESHVFWCEPNAGDVSEAVQAACMVS